METKNEKVSIFSFVAVGLGDIRFMAISADVRSAVCPFEQAVD